MQGAGAGAADRSLRKIGPSGRRAAGDAAIGEISNIFSQLCKFALK
jgi:hypothetical protein